MNISHKFPLKWSIIFLAIITSLVWNNGPFFVRLSLAGPSQKHWRYRSDWWAGSAVVQKGGRADICAQLSRSSSASLSSSNIPGKSTSPINCWNSWKKKFCDHPPHQWFAGGSHRAACHCPKSLLILQSATKNGQPAGFWFGPGILSYPLCGSNPVVQARRTTLEDLQKLLFFVQKQT